MIKLEPGMRVRCVDANRLTSIEMGRDYIVSLAYGRYVGLVGVANVHFPAGRFKPVVRVKAPSVRYGVVPDTIPLHVAVSYTPLGRTHGRR